MRLKGRDRQKNILRIHTDSSNPQHRETNPRLAEVTLQYRDAFADRKREQNIWILMDMEHFALDILIKER